METTDFAKHLSSFLTRYLTGERNYSPNTIMAYKDSFVQFITFMKERKNIEVQKLTFECITKDVVIDFLDWVQKQRHCGNATRNYRLAALRSFFVYLQYENPERMYEWQKILSIKVKKHEKKSINYLTADGIKLLLEQPDLTTQNGRRNLALLALMYDSGARVQEMIDLTPTSVRLDNPSVVKLFGKGRKARIVPLQDEQTVFLKQYMQENHLLEPYANQYPLFSNSRKEKLTRSGVTYILNTCANLARKINPLIIPDTISCHSLRHSKAMHLLQAGVNLVYIRDILGHVSIQTTDVYARADSKQKREAFEKAYVDLNPKTAKAKSWEMDDNLLIWLKSLERKQSIYAK
jgi:site-specific recombinase XerD